MDELPPATHHNVKSSESFSLTEIKMLKHTHKWVIKGFSQCDVRYLETTVTVPDPKYVFRIRLHPQGNKDSNREFCFFQAFCLTSIKYKAKFTVFNSYNEEIQAIVYTGTQQLNGYFEYIRREHLLTHIEPSDEIHLVLALSIVQDTVTRGKAIEQMPPVMPPDMSTKKLSPNLQSGMKERLHTDFVIKCVENKGTASELIRELPCHMFMLASRSPVFHGMLMPHTKEYKNREVILDDIEFETMEQVLTFMYCGCAPKIKDFNLAQDILRLAERFAIDELKELADAWLRTNIAIDNVCDLMMLADIHSATSLKAQCIKFVCKNAKPILATDHWKELASSYPMLATECFSSSVQDIDEEELTPHKRPRLNC